MRLAAIHRVSDVKQGTYGKVRCIHGRVYLEVASQFASFASFRTSISFLCRSIRSLPAPPQTRDTLALLRLTKKEEINKLREAAESMSDAVEKREDNLQALIARDDERLLAYEAEAEKVPCARGVGSWRRGRWRVACSYGGCYLICRQLSQRERSPLLTVSLVMWPALPAIAISPAHRSLACSPG